jgi:uncharacterized membrane protein (DUF106 family)
MSPAAIEVALIAIVVSIATNLVNKKIIDQKRMKEIKKQISDFQKEYNEVKKGGDKELIAKMEKEQKEMMSLTKEMMMGSFKPMMYTFLPIILIFFWIKGNYETAEVIVPVLGNIGWFWWYFIAVVAAGITFEIIYKIATREKK